MNAHKASDAKSVGQQQRGTNAVAAASQPVALGQRLGNQALGQLLRSRRLQAKLTVSNPADVYEQEADRVADQVMRMADPQHRPLSNTAVSVQRSEESSAAPSVDSATEQSISSLSGRGSLLPESVRAFMEPRFGADFSAVRVHTDANAQLLARAVEAKAFTVGNNLVFGAGHFAPETNDGKRLLAHELAHTIQQRGAAPRIARAPEAENILRLTSTGEIVTPKRLIEWAMYQHRPVAELVKEIRGSSTFSGGAQVRKRAAEELLRASDEMSLEERLMWREADRRWELQNQRKQLEVAKRERALAAERAGRRRWLQGHGTIRDPVLQQAGGPRQGEGGVVFFETYDDHGELVTQSYPNMDAYREAIRKELETIDLRCEDVPREVLNHFKRDREVVAETLAEAEWYQRPGLALPGVDMGFSRVAASHGLIAAKKALEARNAARAALRTLAGNGGIPAGNELNEARRMLFQAKHSLQAMLRTREDDDETSLKHLESYSEAGDLATMPLSPALQLAFSTFKNAAVRGATWQSDPNAKFGWFDFVKETGVNFASWKLGNWLAGSNPGFLRAVGSGVGINQAAKVVLTGDVSQFVKIDETDLLLATGGAAVGRWAQMHAQEMGGEPRISSTSEPLPPPTPATVTPPPSVPAHASAASRPTPAPPTAASVTPPPSVPAHASAASQPTPAPPAPHPAPAVRTHDSQVGPAAPEKSGDAVSGHITSDLDGPRPSPPPLPDRSGPNAEINVAVYDARLAAHNERGPTTVSEPHHLNEMSMRGLCGLGSQQVTRSLLNSGVPSERIYVHQAADIAGTTQHGFIVYKTPHGAFLIDTTFAQFAWSRNARALSRSPAGAQLRRNLLNDGYTALTDEVADLYLRMINREGDIRPIRAADLMNERANLATDQGKQGPLTRAAAELAPTPMPTRLPMTPAHRRLLDRLASGVDRTLPPPRSDISAVAYDEVYKRGIDDADIAYAAYNEAYAGSAGREVGLYHNPYTGEYAVMIGSSNSVGPPVADGWETMVHSHSHADTRLPLRLPSPKDMEVVLVGSGHSERVSQFTEFDIPGVGRGRVEFGVDRAHPNEPFYVTNRPENGPPETVRFTSIDSFQEYRGRDTIYAERGDGLYEDLMGDVRTHYAKVSDDWDRPLDNAAVGRGRRGSRRSGPKAVLDHALLDGVVDDARRAVTADRDSFGLKRSPYLPDHLNREVMSGACSFASQQVAEALMRRGVSSKDIYVNQANDIFGMGAMNHEFIVYQAPGGIDILIDTTFVQFTNRRINPKGVALLEREPGGAQLLRDLLGRGYTVLSSDDIANLYLRVVADGRVMPLAVRATHFKRPNANLARLLPSDGVPELIDDHPRLLPPPPPGSVPLPVVEPQAYPVLPPWDDPYPKPRPRKKR